jgi:hypothetical protein
LCADLIGRILLLPVRTVLKVRKQILQAKNALIFQKCKKSCKNPRFSTCCHGRRAENNRLMGETYLRGTDCTSLR